MSADIVMWSSPKDAERIIRIFDKNRQHLGLQKKDLLDELHQETKTGRVVDSVLPFKVQIQLAEKKRDCL